MSDVPTRLLRETLREAMTPPGADACLDAETLAAWSDGALSTGERTAAAAHASGCARCQALLAAMVRTTPPAPARAWWKTPAFSWLMPIAVGAIAVVVWINVPASRDAHFASAPPPAQRMPAPAPAAPADQYPAPQASADLKDTARPTVGPIAPPPLPKPSDVPRQAFAAERGTAAPSAAPKETLPSSSRGAELDRLRAAAEPAPAAGPTGAQGGAAVAAPAAAPPAAPPLSANAVAPQTAAGGAAAPARPDAASAGAQMLRDLRSADQPAPVARAEILAKAAASAAAPPQIVSPDPNVRWRILAGGRVDRSIDAGATWQAQSTGVSAAPTAGAAPSPTVCWLVGPRGLVLLSIDGRTWQRVTFADAIDLTAVRAPDALNATVTAADGRTFVTSDGGRTWRNGG